MEVEVYVEMIKMICEEQETDVKQEIADFKAAGNSLSRETEELLVSASCR
jgi:hypothetical protein